jgi:hypothetical protein
MSLFNDLAEQFAPIFAYFLIGVGALALLTAALALAWRTVIAWLCWQSLDPHLRTPGNFVRSMLWRQA